MARKSSASDFVTVHGPRKPIEVRSNVDRVRVRTPTDAERARALTYLARVGALDLAPMLGLAPSPAGPKLKTGRIPESWRAEG